MKTHIGIVLDRSGSMASMPEEACGCFNAFRKGLKKVEGKKRVTLIQFDNIIETVFSDLRRKETPKLVHGKNYVPRGSTALYDAIGKMIETLGNVKHAVIAVITDGYENSSQEYSHDALSKLIDRKKGDGWDFQFLAAGLNAVPIAHGLGIMKTASFSNDARGYAFSSQTITSNVADYAATRGASANVAQDLNQMEDEDLQPPTASSTTSSPLPQ